MSVCKFEPLYVESCLCLKPTLQNHDNTFCLLSLSLVYSLECCKLSFEKLAFW